MRSGSTDADPDDRVPVDDEWLAPVVLFVLAITLHNMPEGLAGARSGLVEIPLVLVGVLAVTVAATVLPYAMGFAAGAMIYVMLYLDVSLE
jgi:ZIP family zinc transporter